MKENKITQSYTFHSAARYCHLLVVTTCHTGTPGFLDHPDLDLNLNLYLQIVCRPPPCGSASPRQGIQFENPGGAEPEADGPEDVGPEPGPDRSVGTGGPESNQLWTHLFHRDVKHAFQASF